jgi:type II secretion system (T2SS) protein K
MKLMRTTDHPRGFGFQSAKGRTRCGEPMSHRQDANTTKFRIRDTNVSAAALILSLWALLLLSAMVISWALEINSRLTVSGNASRVLEAEAMACSGAEVALHPLVTPASPNLRRQLEGRQSYEAHITGEGGRLNINWLVAGEDPSRVEILRRYLENKGIDLNERNVMIDSLLDWVSPNTGLHHLNAPPESDDYRPAHSLLTRIEELKGVFGWAEFTSKPGWDEDFTLNSSGPIDLAWASRDVLLALPGMTDQLVDRFLLLRRGPDGIDGTADDAPLKSMDDVRAALGLSVEQFQQLASMVAFRDQVFRIVSVGKSGDVTRVVQMVVRKLNNSPQLIAWKEL